jgi:hypothetical protein
MWKLWILVIAILLLPTPAHSYEFAQDWTWKDTALQGTYIALNIVDWGQTRYALKHPLQFYECNPVYRNSPDRIDILMPLMISIDTVIALALPSKAEIFGVKVNPRRLWQYFLITSETTLVINNARIGVKIDF